MIMGLFSFGNKYVELQNIVLKINEKKMVVSKNELISAVNLYISDRTRIIGDCVRLINTTKKPDIFLKRFEMLKDNSKELEKIEKFELFKRPYPSEQLQTIIDNYNETVNRLSDRIMDDALKKCEKLKTNKSKNKKITEAYYEFVSYEFPEPCLEYMKELKENNLFDE